MIRPSAQGRSLSTYFRLAFVLLAIAAVHLQASLSSSQENEQKPRNLRNAVTSVFETIIPLYVKTVKARAPQDSTHFVSDQLPAEQVPTPTCRVIPSLRGVH